MSLKSLIPVGRERSDLAQITNPFTSLQQEIDRLFDDFGRNFPRLGALGFTQAGDLVPRMDVKENDKAIELTAELPGLTEKDVEVDLADNVLTVRGEKKAEKDEKKQDYRTVERRYGSFLRRIELPAGVDPAAITASLSNGVLTVSVPKPAPSITKKIEVKSAA
jgi:HSP20 family protein